MHMSSFTAPHPVLSDTSANLIISKLSDPFVPYSALTTDSLLFNSYLNPFKNFIDSTYSRSIDDIRKYYSAHTSSIFAPSDYLDDLFDLVLHLSVIMPRKLFPTYFNAVLRAFGCSNFNYSEFFPKSKTQPFGYHGRLQAMRYIVIAIIMESIREAYGSPLRITSGYRPSKYNSSVNGANNSYHTRYRAVDFVPVSAEVAADILNNPSSFNQLVQQFKPVEVIFGKNYIHLAI